MTKFIIIFIFIYSIGNTYAFMPEHVNYFIVGRVSDVKNKDDKLQVKLYNYINYKISDSTDLFGQKDYFGYMEYPLNTYTLIKGNTKNIDIKKGDIVSFTMKNQSASEGILKLECNKGIMNIMGTQDKLFGTKVSTTDREMLKNYRGNDDLILEKVNEVIGCDNLYTFFYEDRKYQDLFGKNIGYYYYIFLGIKILVLIILFFLFKNVYLFLIKVLIPLLKNNNTKH